MGGMRNPSPLPESLDSGPFTLQQARDLGVGNKRTLARDLIIPTRGTRMPAAFEDDFLTKAAACSMVVPGSVVGFSTAATLWKIPLPERMETGIVHLIQPPGSRACRRNSVKGHVLELDEADISKGRSLNATSPERTWFDLSKELTVDELVIAGDHLVRRQDPLSSMDRLLHLVEGMARRRGVKKAKEALRWIRPRTDSPKETELRLVLIRAGLPEPAINVAILDENGQWVQDPDMGYPDLKIAMQYDGGHHITEMQRRSDIARDDRAVELGWTVLKYCQPDLIPGWYGGEPTAVRKTRWALDRKGHTIPKAA